jgi:asparagine synthase (glutamine-hydrolysing)
MCGFAGYLGNGPWNNPDAAPPLLKRMADTITSRGPDDWGLWHAPGIGLAHRRLSIVDLSAAGHQPMVCHADRLVMVFNGEIYNHLELRKELHAAGLAPTWRGHSDTETLLAGFLSWGVRATIERCVGMFAFALWDKHDRVLHLGRDRLGEKPLYYGWQGQGESASFLFGSELKALKAHPAFVAEVDRNALCLLMRHNYINAPHSIYQGISKLPPGYLLTVSLERREPSLQQYWSLTDVAQAGVAAPLNGSFEDVTNSLEQLLKTAVRQQMVADVPLGAFLSGGIDSSLIVALMQAQSDRPVRTFSIGFHEKGYDEAVYAKAVAKHLQTDHTELYVTAQQALDVIPKLPHLYCEPMSDSSQIPTFLVSQLARQHATVALSGDAGDELFGGYSRYIVAHDVWNKVSRIPPPFRSMVASIIRLLSPAGWSALLGPVQPLLPSALRKGNAGSKLHKGADLLSMTTVDQLYLKFLTHWEPEHLVLGGREPLSCLRGSPLQLQGLDPIQRMMVLDGLTYLPGDILAKVDRAAMGVSLETRVPFLDHRVVEFAWRIPQSMKLHSGQTKRILREVLYRHVPQALIDRPKMGFGVPIGVWLRGVLRDWAEDLLNEQRLRSDGFFHPEPISKMWTEHLSGRYDWQYPLWDVLMFQAWLGSQTGVNPSGPFSSD